MNLDTAATELLELVCRSIDLPLTGMDSVERAALFSETRLWLEDFSASCEPGYEPW